jgi:hypothetical protein
MSKVWDRVVEDLQKQSETKVEKTFLQKMWNVVFKDGCKGDGCKQGRDPSGCNCKE